MPVLSAAHGVGYSISATPVHGRKAGIDPCQTPLGVVQATLDRLALPIRGVGDTQPLADLRHQTATHPALPP